MGNFENSQYAKLFESTEGRQIMSAIVTNPDLLRSNHTFWDTKFRIDPNITPTDADGKATFISRMRKIETGNMMHMRAPLADSKPREKGNLKFYTGVIPDFISDGYVEKAPERMYKEKLFNQFGDAYVIAAFAQETLQGMLDDANQTLSNMSAQLMSKGNIVYTYGEGIHENVLKADIPAENFKTAGAVSWADTTNCKILDQVRKMYNDIQEALGVKMPMQLEVTRNNWNNYWLKNAQVIEWVRYFKSINNVLLPNNIEITNDMAVQALATYEGLPQIVIIEESQKDGVHGIVHGWADNIAVMRPLGYAGYIRHTTILDEEVYTKYGNKTTIKRNFASALNGLAMFMNTTLLNGNLKEWHTDLMMTAVPSLDEFLYHYIINTTTID